MAARLPLSRAALLPAGYAGIIGHFGYAGIIGRFGLAGIICHVALSAAPAMADGQAWFAVEAKGEIADGLLLLTDVNYRLTQDATHPGQIQLRGFLGHQFGTVTVAAGYSWIHTSKPGSDPRNEHRLTQQVEIPLLDRPGIKLAARTRLEQRFYTDMGGVSWRLRERLKLTVPIDANGLSLISHAELLAALNDGPSGAQGGDVQTRAFGGFGIPFTHSVLLEAGYLNQHDWQRSKTTNHILTLTLHTRF